MPAGSEERRTHRSLRSAASFQRRSTALRAFACGENSLSCVRSERALASNLLEKVMKKLHWLQNRVTFYALDRGPDCADENFITIATHALNNEADLAALAKRYPGLSYVVQMRELILGSQADPRLAQEEKVLRA